LSSASFLTSNNIQTISNYLFSKLKTIFGIRLGPMNGEASVVYHDPAFGDYPFGLEIERTKWDELGRVTEGKIVFTDVEYDLVIEMTAKKIRGDPTDRPFVFRVI
jgi:hypothetical protein